MIRVFRVLIVLAVLVVIVGFYRGWFAFSRSAPNSESNKVNINLATDPDKMKQDAQLVKDKASELTGGATKDVNANDPVNDTGKTNER